eukprot:tig00020610_g12063.t1
MSRSCRASLRARAEAATAASAPVHVEHGQPAAAGSIPPAGSHNLASRRGCNRCTDKQLQAAADGHVHFIPQQYTREYVITAKDEKTQALDALYDAFRNGTATLQSGPKSCLVMPAPPAPIAALPAPQLPEDDDEDTPKRRSGGRKATVISSDESDNASATGDDPIEVSSDEEGAAPELDAAEAPVVKSASAPKKATGMKGLMALAAPRLLGTKAARLLGAGVSKGKKTKKPAAPKAAKSKDTKGGKKTKAVQ